MWGSSSTILRKANISKCRCLCGTTFKHQREICEANGALQKAKLHDASVQATCLAFALNGRVLGSMTLCMVVECKKPFLQPVQPGNQLHKLQTFVKSPTHCASPWERVKVHFGPYTLSTGLASRKATRLSRPLLVLRAPASSVCWPICPCGSSAAKKLSQVYQQRTRILNFFLTLRARSGQLAQRPLFHKWI